MKSKTFLPIIFMLILAFSASAYTELSQPIYDYSEGSWNDTNTAEMAADYDYTDFGHCEEDECLVMMNFTVNTSGYYDSAIWGVNFTTTINGENALLQMDCWAYGEPWRAMILFNMSDLDNGWLGCENRSDVNTWLPLDDAFNMSVGQRENISGQYLLLTDNAPTVTMNDDINGSTKNCSEDGIRESDIIFTADDSLDTEMDCCVYVNDVEDTSSCNSSIQDETESVLHTDALGEGDNTVYVRCEDENSYGDSNSMTLRGQSCAVCDTDWMADFIKFAVLTALLIFFAANYFANNAHFKQYWWYIAAFIAICFIIWWLQNWNC